VSRFSRLHRATRKAREGHEALPDAIAGAPRTCGPGSRRPLSIAIASQAKRSAAARSRRRRVNRPKSSGACWLPNRCFTRPDHPSRRRHRQHVRGGALCRAAKREAGAGVAGPQLARASTIWRHGCTKRVSSRSSGEVIWGLVPSSLRDDQVQAKAQAERDEPRVGVQRIEERGIGDLPAWRERGA